MKYTPFPAPYFNHFIQPSPPIISKLKSLHGIFRNQLSPEKWSQPFVAFPPFDNFKMTPTPSPCHSTYMLFQVL